MTGVVCFLGPPGSGKGYNSIAIYEEYRDVIDIERFSVGDYLRRRNKADKSGNLSDTAEVTSIIDDFLAKKKDFYIIDGYPRSTDQAKAIFEKLKSGEISKICVVSLIVPDEKILISRLTTRHNCFNCGFSFAKNDTGLCPSCGGDSYIREDDLVDKAITRRIHLYNTCYDEVKKYFLLNDIDLYEIDSSGDKSSVCAEITKKLLPFFEK